MYNAKKSQVTSFIIAGIVILLVIFIAVLFLRQRIAPEEITVQQERQIKIDALKKYAFECLQPSSEEGLLLLGQQGGKLVMPEQFLSAYYSNIHYSSIDSKNLLVGKSELEQHLNEYVNLSMQVCINNFKSFESQGMSVDINSVDIQSSMNKLDVDVTVTYDILLDNNIAKLLISYKIPVRAGDIHDIASQIIDKYNTDPDWLDLTYLNSFNYPVSLIPHSKEDFIITIGDKSSIISGSNYVFFIAIKQKPNLAPSLVIDDEYILKSGLEFELRVAATDPESDNITFSDDTAMFDMTDVGVIRFMPRITGTFPVTITATDNHGNSDKRLVNFVVQK